MNYVFYLEPTSKGSETLAQHRFIFFPFFLLVGVVSSCLLWKFLRFCQMKIGLFSQSYRIFFDLPHTHTLAATSKGAAVANAMLLACVPSVVRVSNERLVFLVVFNSLSHFWLVYWVCKRTKRKKYVGFVWMKNATSHHGAKQEMSWHGNTHMRDADVQKSILYGSYFVPYIFRFYLRFLWIRLKHYTNECFRTFVWCN